MRVWVVALLWACGGKEPVDSGAPETDTTTPAGTTGGTGGTTPTGPTGTGTAGSSTGTGTGTTETADTGTTTPTDTTVTGTPTETGDTGGGATWTSPCAPPGPPSWGPAPPDPHIEVNRTSYCRGDELYTRWAEVDGLTAFSFLAMGRVGGDDSDWERALIIGFAASGEFTFTHLPRDCLLEARLYGVEGEVLHRSAPFEVDCSGPEASIAADRDVYAAGDPITFEWEDADGWALDWIGVYPAEAPPDAYVAFAYTDPLFSGPYAGSLTWEDMTFMAEDPLPPGEYEVRLMEDNGFVVQATGRFTVE